jgi:FMN phosphatase YigB (HAD superfamily)
MEIDCFILDFDGTFTDVEREAAPFLSGYRRDLVERFGPQLAAEWETAEAEVRANPAAHGWQHGGVVVAPGNTDPYVRATVTASLLFDRHGLLPDPDARTETLQGLYARNYGRAEPVFRPEAREVLEAILATGKPVYVVSNSDTTAVEHKLAVLGPAGLDRLTVRGEARKYTVAEPSQSDARFEALPRTLTVEGLGRPLYLRRGPYYEVLRQVWTEAGTGPERTLVVGDIYELDLALPGHLGAEVHLLVRPTTPEHEPAMVRQRHGGGVSDDLRPLLERVRPIGPE